MNFVLLYLGLAWGSDHKDSETGVSNLFGTQGWVLEISEKTFFFFSWNPLGANKFYFPVLIHTLTEAANLQKF